MTDIANSAPNGGIIGTETKSYFSIFKTKKTLFAFTFLFAFIASTIFVAFGPSSSSASPWFSKILPRDFTSAIPSSSSIFSNGYHFSPIFSYFFPNVKHHTVNTELKAEVADLKPNHTRDTHLNDTVANLEANQTRNTPLNDKVGNLKANQTHTNQLNDKYAHKGAHKDAYNGAHKDAHKGAHKDADKDAHTQTQDSQFNSNVANFEPHQSQDGKVKRKSETLKADQHSSNVSKTPRTTNHTVSSEVKNNRSDQKSTYAKVLPGTEDLVKSLVKCDMYDGHWVKDDSYPLYKPDSCSLIDEQFNCFSNGRPDHDYDKLKWKPKGCTIPRLNGEHMLELLRGKRLAFVGDSLNRNMWESLVCILRNSVKDQKKVYELNGIKDFRSEVSYAFVFEDYDLRVEFYVSPFLVQEWEVQDKSGSKKETLRLDLVGETSKAYKNADIIVFNTAHWWTHEKTSSGKDYYQEGNHVYDELNVNEALRKALTTWAIFVDTNINPSKTHVMFRGYSASHFSGGQWNSGGQCHHETQPIKKEKYLMNYPPMMTIVENVLKNMKVPVSYLNITRMSDYRKDAHPSIYRTSVLARKRKLLMRVQDCSHWCLPGVPDSWNELLYAELLVRMIGKKQ